MTIRRKPNPKVAKIEIRVTPDQKERIQQSAASARMTVSEWLLDIALRQGQPGAMDGRK